jgi:hypothetical protein
MHEESGMGREDWTNERLDAMREVGDPVADAAVGALFAAGGVGAVNDLTRTLVQNDGIASAELPPIIRDYLAETAALPEIDSEKVRRGEAFFGALGPEILTALGFYGLPASYAAKKGVQVLHRTVKLTQQPIRRIFETTQMVMDVMAEGGLGPGGRGVRTAQKVRLMHAAVRHLLTHDPQQPWDASLGVPINQEDEAGTLMTFSYLVLDGLDRLGLKRSDEDREAYFHSWMVVGRLLGVCDELIPANVAEGKALTEIIHQRQVGPSPEGQQLTAALVEGFQGIMPGPLKGVPASLVHFFLDQDPFGGKNVSEMLGVPPADWSEHLVCLLDEADAAIKGRGIECPAADKVVTWVSREMIEGMLLVERGGQRAPFSIPAGLGDRWGLKSAA